MSFNITRLVVCLQSIYMIVSHRHVANKKAGRRRCAVIIAALGQLSVTRTTAETRLDQQASCADVRTCHKPRYRGYCFND